MNPNEFGKRLGIGVRVAGRIAQQRAGQAAQGPTAPTSSPRIVPNGQEIREIKEKSHRLTRAAGRGVGGFLRPFGRVGGILWLEITGFFFGLFGLYFAVDIWRSRLGYSAGPLHQRFLISAALTVVFAYLGVSAFWRARRR